MVKNLMSLVTVLIFLSCNQESTNKVSQDFPVPTNGTVIKEDMEEGGEREKREAWIELLHQSAPDVNWREVESERAWSEHLTKANDLKLNKRSPNVSIANGRLTGEWIEKGSSNLSGSVIATAYDPEADELYVVGAGGCLFKSTRDGESWQVVNQDLRFGGQILNFIDHNGAIRLIGVVDRAPAYSDDLGANWLPAEGWEVYSDTWGNIFSPAIHKESGHIVAMSKSTYWENLSVYVSDDGGESYKEVMELGSHDANKYSLITEANSGRLILVDKVNNENIDFYQYDPSTSSFELESVSRNVGFGADGVANLAATAIDDSTSWYYILQNRRATFFSDDLGATWVQRDSIDENAWGVGLFVSPSDPEFLLVGAVQCYRSHDGGKSFEMINRWQDYYGDPVNKLHADMMYFNEFVTSDGTIFNTISNHGGLNLSYDQCLFTPSISQDGLNVSQYYSVRTDPFYRDYIYAGSQDQGFQRGVNDNNTAIPFDQIISGDYGHIVFSAGGSNMWSVYPGGWVIYYDDPRNQRYPALTYSLDSDDETVWIPPLAEIPYSPKDAVYMAGGSVYGGQGSYLINLEVMNGAIQASQIDFDFKQASAGGTISAIHVSPIDPNFLYVATTNGKFYYSNDKGQSWTSSRMNVPGGHYLYGASIVSSSYDPSVIYMGGSGYSNSPVVRSENGGQFMLPFSSGLPPTTVFQLALDPEEQLLFAATEAGPYVCLLDEEKWYPMAEGVAPNQTYWTVEYLYPEKIARFGTYGRGIWDFEVENLGTNTVDKTLPAASWKVFPNPVKDQFNIEVSPTLDEDFTILLTDMNGRFIRQWNSAPGNTYNVGNLTAGLYMLGISSDNNTSWKRIVIE